MSVRLDIEDIVFVETLIRGCGLSSCEVLAELGLPLNLFEVGANWHASLSDYVRILSFLAEMSGDETCTGSARQILPGTTPFLLAGVSENSRLGEVFQRLADGYNIAHGAAYNRVRISPNRLSYIIDDKDFPYSHPELAEHSHAFIESILVSLHGLFGEITGQPLANRVIRVSTKRQPTDPGGSFLKFWHAPIRFGARYYSVEYDGRVASWPVTKPGKTSYLSIFDAASNDPSSDGQSCDEACSWSERVRHVIASGINKQAAAGAWLGVSPATMRRRLASEGTSFRSLRADALNARARRLLARGEPVDQVADKLGFSDLRSFSRAFVGWNSLTPTAFRDRADTASAPQP